MKVDLSKEEICDLDFICGYYAEQNRGSSNCYDHIPLLNKIINGQNSFNSQEIDFLKTRIQFILQHPPAHKVEYPFAVHLMPEVELQYKRILWKFETPPWLR